MTHITIDKRKIGRTCPTYVIAEMSANHGQDYERAMEMVHAAKEVGADAIKLQTYTPDTLTIDCDNDYFRIGKGTIWEGKNLYELYKEAYTPWDWQPRLQNIARDIGLDFFSTPFDPTAVDFLEGMNVPCHKVASFELVDIPLLRKIGSTQKPVIMSTGMATLGEIDDAVKALRESGCPELALLKCTSAYPAQPEEMNLLTIPHLAEAFKCPTGLSDHTLGTAVPVAAVSLGACIIEKHFTLSRDIPGPDSSFSLEPAEFKEMVESIRTVERAIGNVSYELTEKEQASRVFRRSLYVVKDIAKGEKLTKDNIRSIRPGYGLPPKLLPNLIGKIAKQEIPYGTALNWDHFE